MLWVEPLASVIVELLKLVNDQPAVAVLVFGKRMIIVPDHYFRIIARIVVAMMRHQPHGVEGFGMAEYPEVHC